MKKEELKKLKELINNQKEINERISKLLNEENIKEYLKLTNTEEYKLKDNQDILKEALTMVKITPTEDIWIYIQSFNLENFIYDNPFYFHETNTENNDTTGKIYYNIENLEIVQATIKRKTNYALVKDFEKEHTIIYPANIKGKTNHFTNIRLEYMKNVIDLGQNKAKKLLLDKYKRV